jgi:hypothetical protein
MLHCALNPFVYFYRGGGGHHKGSPPLFTAPGATVKNIYPSDLRSGLFEKWAKRRFFESELECSGNFKFNRIFFFFIHLKRPNPAIQKS